MTGYDTFLSHYPVPRETLERLCLYSELIRKWQPHINLISHHTLPFLWPRHILDSAQLFPHLPYAAPIYDLGSGAGFPGMVLALLGAPEVNLIESDRRKVAFLQEVKRIAHCDNVTIRCERVEQAALPANAVITARAFAPLANLFELVENALTPDTQFLLLKGRHCDEERLHAETQWRFSWQRLKSLEGSDGAILHCRDVSRR